MTRRCETVRLGDYIIVLDETNTSRQELPMIGINRDKEFMPTVANVSDVDIRKYKIVRPGYFVFSGMQTGRDVCIRLGLYQDEQPALISPAYTTFKVDESKGLLSEFFFMYFNRGEMDRYGWFISDSSVRANLDWPRFLDIQIPKPSPEHQREFVAIWKHLRKVKEENEALAAPLFQLCQSKIQELKHDLAPVEIGRYIQQSDARNINGEYTPDDVRGLATSKEIINTKANMDGVSVSSYKLMRPHEFAYVPDTSRRGDKVSMGFNSTEVTFIVSSISEVFRIKDESLLLPDYLFMWFKRPEFDRYARFNSWGSAREAFCFEDMQHVSMPIPDINVQKAIVEIYNCAQEAKRIATEADKLSKEICPALMQKVINS